jgi:hypothetical protein
MKWDQAREIADKLDIPLHSKNKIADLRLRVQIALRIFDAAKDAFKAGREFEFENPADRFKKPS